MKKHEPAQAPGKLDLLNQKIKQIAQGPYRIRQIRFDQSQKVSVPRYLGLADIRRHLPAAAATLVTMTLVLALTIGPLASEMKPAVPVTPDSQTAASTSNSNGTANIQSAGNPAAMAATTDASTLNESPFATGSTLNLAPDADPFSSLLDGSGEFARSQSDLYQPETGTSNGPDLTAAELGVANAGLLGVESEEASVSPTPAPTVDGNGVVLETLAPDQFTSDNAKLYIQVSKANIRSLPNSEAGIVATQLLADSVTRLGYGTAWSKVRTASGKTGYMLSRLLTKTKPKVTSTSSNQSSMPSSKKAQMVSVAKSLLGTRYVLGGASRSGIDCSGFTLYVYNKVYGISLPHKASLQARRGTSVSKSLNAMQIGDLICFDWNSDGTVEHVGLYIGGGKYIDASVSAGRVRTCSISGSTYWRHIKTIRRIVH